MTGENKKTMFEILLNVPSDGHVRRQNNIVSDGCFVVIIIY